MDFGRVSAESAGKCPLLRLQLVDSVEKLVVFDRLMLVITLISFGCS